MSHKVAIVVINDTEISPIIINNQPVLTLAMIDKIHGRPQGTARRNFNDNKTRMTDGEDFFVVTRESPMDEIRTLGNIPPKGITLLTESGYLLLVKSFTDDLAWRIQKQLVQAYFRAGKPNVVGESIDALLPSEQQTLMEVAHRRLADLHDSLHGKAMAEIWSRVHRKFRVAKYSQLPRTQLTDAILYITKMELRTATLAPEPEALPERVISSEELEQIKELVDNIASCFKSQQHNTLMGAIYRGIKNQVRIGSISEFPASRYDNAIKTLSGIHHQAMEHASRIRKLERITLKEMGIPVT